MRNQLVVSHKPSSNQILISAAILAAYLAYRRTAHAQNLREWLHSQTQDATWTEIALVYSAVVLGTFVVGYIRPETRPALLAWYLF